MTAVYSWVAALLLVQIPQQQVGPSHPAPRLGPDPTVRFFISASSSSRSNPDRRDESATGDLRRDPGLALCNVKVGITRVVMISAGGDRVIFRAKPAYPVDLRRLMAGGAPLAMFLARGVVPNGVYDGMRIELDDQMTVDGKTVRLTKPRFGFEMLTIEFPAPERFDSNRNVFINFDLVKWSMKGGEVAIQTETDPETKHVTELGVTLRSPVPAEEVADQVPVTLDGFVTGPIGRPPAPLTGVRQAGWILPVRFPSPRPSRGNVVRITGTFSAPDDAFRPTKVEWLKGAPALTPK